MNLIFKISVNLIILSLELSALSQWNYNEPSDTLEGSVHKGSIQLAESTKKLSSAKGFPILDCTHRDGSYVFPKDRFLVKSNEGKYFVINSTLDLIIEESDSIIAFSHNVNSENSVFNVSCNPDYRGKKKIYYQAVRNGLTILYDYDGRQVTSTAYSGEIFEGSYNFEFNNSYWVSINCHCESMKMGLIDSLGKCIAKQVSIKERFINQFDPYYENLWNYRNSITNEVQLIDANTGKIILSYEALNSDRNEYGILVYSWKGKIGMFHPSIGVLLQPKYDNITLVNNSEDTYLLVKKGKKKKWIVNDEIKNNYTQQRLKGKL